MDIKFTAPKLEMVQHSFKVGGKSIKSEFNVSYVKINGVIKFRVLQNPDYPTSYKLQKKVNDSWEWCNFSLHRNNKHMLKTRLMEMV